MCFERNTENETFVFKNKIKLLRKKINVISIDNKLTLKHIFKNLCKKDLQKV